jgi:hypothetical protein
LMGKNGSTINSFHMIALTKSLHPYSSKAF